MKTSARRPKPRQINRLRAAWHVLRGRPLIYGCTFHHDLFLPETGHVLILENYFQLTPDDAEALRGYDAEAIAAEFLAASRRGRDAGDSTTSGVPR